MGLHSFFRVGLAAGALSIALAATPIDNAKASGPVERLLQVLTSPTDPNALIVRYGAASEGLLFSRDGGRTFRAMCTSSIERSVSRISSGASLYTSPITIDARGNLMINTFDALWVGDGTGCKWTKDPGTEGKWLSSVEADPSKPDEVLAVANVSTGEDENLEARAELMRRDASGVWSVIGPVRKPVAGLRAYGADLIAVKTTAGTRLYVALTAASGSLEAPQRTSVAVSEDGGKTWSESKPLPASQEYMSLLAADPTQPDRLLGVVTSGGRDALFLSQDKGKTFKAYGTGLEVSGATFAPDGRVFIGDASADGGVLTAAKLGQPLTKVPAVGNASPSVDCVDYDTRANKLRVCKLNRMGELNYQTGAFTELVQFESVQGLLDCPGRDMKAACEAQLNAGPAWCCTGHYPFTGFCGEWDIQEMRGRRVACGLSGRAAEIEAGRGPTITNEGDAAVGGASSGALPSLYSQVPESRAEGSSGEAPEAATAAGCSLAGGQPRTAFSAGALLGLFAFTAVRRARRRARVSPRRS
jgi:hypothetical protein